MTVRFLADEDLDVALIEGLRSREPAIDILDVKAAGLHGTKDPALLELAAQQGRIMVSHDRETMPKYFRERLGSGKLTAGLFVVPQQPSAIGVDRLRGGGMAGSDRLYAVPVNGRV